MLTLTEIDKSFGTTHAVKAVTLQAHPGAVLGLAGENGAGKSTLIKMVSGAIAPGGGRMILDGKPIAPRDTNDAITQGISGVFQELTLVGELSVEQNLFLTAAPTNAIGMIDRRRLRAMATEVLARHALDIDPAARVADLPLGSRQMIEIVRAIERKPLVPMSGQGENGWRQAMLQYKDKGLQGVSAGDPSVIGAYALKIAYEILEGKGPKEKKIDVPVPTVTTEQLKAGVNVFPDLPPTLDADTDIPGADLGLTIQDGMKK